MILYGTATLAICMLLGKIIGSLIGELVGVDADIGGVGFAMVMLIFASAWLRKRNLLPQPTEQGILFWSAMYIPIVIAMASIQNVSSAVAGGPMALIAGGAALAGCLALVPVVARIGTPSEPLPPLGQEENQEESKQEEKPKAKQEEKVK